MTLKLYAHPFSSYCQKVLIALYENDTPFEFRMLAPRRRGGDARARGAMANEEISRARRRRPTVIETSIIIEHLRLHHPGPVRLVPEDPKRRARGALHGPLLRQLRLDAAAEARVRQHPRARQSATRRASPRRERCSRPPIAGWTTRWRGAHGRRATISASPTAPRRQPCSMPTGPIRSMRRSPMSAPIGKRLLARPSFARAVDEARPYRPLFPLGAPDRD